MNLPPWTVIVVRNVGMLQVAYADTATRRDLVAEAAKNPGFARALGLTPGRCHLPHLLTQVDNDLRAYFTGIYSNELEMLADSARLQSLVQRRETPPFCYHKAVPWAGSMSKARARAQKLLQRQRRKAGWRGGSRVDLRRWLVATGRLAED